jgi:hypothetical protein
MLVACLRQCDRVALDAVAVHAARQLFPWR